MNIIQFIKNKFKNFKDFISRFFKKGYENYIERKDGYNTYNQIKELVVHKYEGDLVENKKRELLIDYYERCDKKMAVYRMILSNEEVRSNIESMIKRRMETYLQEADEEKYRDALVNEAQKLSQMYKQHNFDRIVIELFDDMTSIAYKKFLGKSDQICLENIDPISKEDNEMIPFNSHNGKEVVIYNEANVISNNIDVIVTEEVQKKVIKLYDKDLIIDDIFVVKIAASTSRFSIYRDKRQKLEYVVFPNGKYQVCPYDGFWKEDLQI